MHNLTTTQTLTIPLEEAWAFFSNPQNLALITPPRLGLVPTSVLPEKTYPGLLISYKVRPVLGIPLLWVTEITHVVEQVYFVDEQRIGPYSLWHHQHHFQAVPNGTLMTDIVDYRLPGGPVGRLLHWFFIRKKVQEIFEYRRTRLVKLFGNR